MDTNKRTDMFSEENKISEEYDYLHLSIPHHDEFQRQVGVTLLEYYKESDSPYILELGTGTGLTAREVMKVLPQATLLAVDAEEIMLKQAKAKAIPGNVEFRQVDGTKFLEESAEGIFEVVVSGYVIHNFNHALREKWIKEIFRVLKPGGIFINADKYVYDDEDHYRQIYDKQIKMFDVYDEIGKPHLKKEWTEHFAVDDSEPIRQVEGRYKEILKEVGFVDIKVTYREMIEGIIVAKKPE